MAAVRLDPTVEFFFIAIWPERLDWLLPRLDAVSIRVGLSVRRLEYEVKLVEADARAIAAQVGIFTMTDPIAVVGLLDAINNLDAADVDGAFVDCAVRPRLRLAGCFGGHAAMAV